MDAIAFRFSSDAALQALITKVESLISAVSTVASNAASTASTALSNAQTALAASRYHGTCATAAATAAKVVTCSGFTRVTGSRIAVKFTYANTAANPTLNVNSTGAASIRIGGVAGASGDWGAGEVCLFEFDGTYWNLIKTRPSTLANITGTLAIAKGGTGATTAAKALSNIGAAAASHSHALTSCTGTLSIAKGGTGATSAAAALAALGAASCAVYTCTCNTTWSGSTSAGFTKTITVSGITANDRPVVGVVMSSDIASAKNQGAAFACINRITTATNSITCYAFTTKPTVSITLQLLCVRDN